MHVLNGLEGKPDETEDLDGSQHKPEAGVCTDIDWKALSDSAIVPWPCCYLVSAYSERCLQKVM